MNVTLDPSVKSKSSQGSVHLGMFNEIEEDYEEANDERRDSSIKNELQQLVSFFVLSF